MTFTLLTGAKINVGDFLIAYRAKALLRQTHPGVELVELPRWLPLEENLEEINRSRALILCGGPAFRPRMYPDIYPLVDDLRRISVPIIPMALGWKGVPGDEQSIREYRFVGETVELLERMRSQETPLSCRDHLTQRVLQAHGMNRIRMTGCAAWYDIDFLGREFTPPEEIRRVVFSIPAGSQFFDQAIDVLRGAKRILPHAGFVCAFNHGWTPTSFLGSQQAATYEALRGRLMAEGHEVLDLGSNLPLMLRTAQEADLHIGYRLHHHLLFLSQRKPSFLLEEDGRGRGASESLGIRGIAAWSRPPVQLGMRQLARSVPWLQARAPWKRLFSRERATPRSDAVAETLAFIEEEVADGFLRFRHIGSTIDSFYDTSMRPFLEALP